MPWLPVDTRDAHDTPPHALRGDLACNPNNAPDFFYDHTNGGDPTYAKARKVCGACPAIAECLEWALKTRQRFGMWGGANPQERTRMLRDPRLRSAAVRYAQTLAATLASTE